jgi:hypothetical protein
MENGLRSLVDEIDAFPTKFALFSGTDSPRSLSPYRAPS